MSKDRIWTMPDPANEPSFFVNDVEFINKQRTVDVLKELLAIHPKATEGAVYGCNQACLRIAKDLGISLEN